jgi:hypothetical protein
MSVHTVTNVTLDDTVLTSVRERASEHVETASGVRLASYQTLTGVAWGRTSGDKATGT